MDDLISRQAAIEAPEKFIKDCNPEHFVGHQKFIEYMDNAEIGSFGNWQFANGFNLGLTAAEDAIKKLPAAQPDVIRCKDCRWWDKYSETQGYCMAAKHGYYSSHWEIRIRRTYGEDFFCADAEPIKEGDEHGLDR